MNDSSSRPPQQRVDSHIESYTRSLEELNRLIGEAEKHLNAMYDQRRVLEGQIVTRRTFHAPINQLPQEVFSEILEYSLCCNHFDEDQHPKLCGRTVIPDLILVCKMWRNTIVNSSQNWKRICLVTHGQIEPDPAWVQRQHKYIDLCLSRSKESLLELTIDLRSHLWATTYARCKVATAFSDIAPLEEIGRFCRNLPDLGILATHYYAMFQGLVSKILGPNGIHLNRCRTLNLRLSEDRHLVQAVWPLLNAKASKMERLLLLSHGTIPNSSETNTKLELPSLARLVIFGYFTLNNIPSSRNLRELDIYPPSWDGLEALNHMPALEILRIGNAPLNIRLDGPGPRVFLPTLQLSIYG